MCTCGMWVRRKERKWQPRMSWQRAEMLSCRVAMALANSARQGRANQKRRSAGCLSVAYAFTQAFCTQICVSCFYMPLPLYLRIHRHIHIYVCSCTYIITQIMQCVTDQRQAYPFRNARTYVCMIGKDIQASYPSCRKQRLRSKRKSGCWRPSTFSCTGRMPEITSIWISQWTFRIFLIVSTRSKRGMANPPDWRWGGGSSIEIKEVHGSRAGKSIGST